MGRSMQIVDPYFTRLGKVGAIMRDEPAIV